MSATKRSAPGPSGSSKSKKGKTATTSELPLGKALASTEKRVRDRAIGSLGAFLLKNGGESLDEAEMLKLWKGLFYCFWMSDKPLVQQALADQLSQLVLLGGGMPFADAFWVTMGREWSGLDKHRVNKFLLLMRRFLNAGFRLLATQGWQDEKVDEYVEILTKPGAPLCPNDPKVPTSITYHVTEIYLEELENALTNALDNDDDQDDEDSDVNLVPTHKLISSFVRLLAHTHTAKTYETVMDGVIQPLLDDCQRAAELAQHEAFLEKNPEYKDDEDDMDVMVSYPMLLALTQPSASPDADDDESEDDGPRAIRAAVYRQIFAVASGQSAAQARRTKLYAFWREEQDRLNDAAEESE